MRPFLARLLGVSELRIRLAGSGSTDGRLAYLSVEQATTLRHALLAPHRRAAGDQGLAADRRDEGPALATVTTGRLVASVPLSLAGVVVVGAVAVLATLDQFEPPHGPGGGRGHDSVPDQLRRDHLAPAVGAVRLRGPRGS